MESHNTRLLLEPLQGPSDMALARHPAGAVPFTMGARNIAAMTLRLALAR